MMMSYRLMFECGLVKGVKAVREDKWLWTHTVTYHQTSTHPGGVKAYIHIEATPPNNVLAYSTRE